MKTMLGCLAGEFAHGLSPGATAAHKGFDDANASAKTNHSAAKQFALRFMRRILLPDYVAGTVVTCLASSSPAVESKSPATCFPQARATIAALRAKRESFFAGVLYVD
jgi:hypothetical protein